MADEHLWPTDVTAGNCCQDSEEGQVCARVWQLLGLLALSAGARW